jgi:hypothetical protein
MNDTNPHGGAVDRAIDRAVRQMMSADAPPGLRRRVLARIEGPAPGAALFPRLAMAAAALALVVLAVVMLRPSPQPATEVVRTQAEPAPATPPVPAPTPAARPIEAARHAQVTAAAPRRPAVTSEEIRMPRITNVFGARTVRADAAAAADDVVFSQEDARPSASDLPGVPPPISVPPITIAPLQIERLRLDQAPTRK